MSSKKFIATIGTGVFNTAVCTEPQFVGLTAKRIRDSMRSLDAIVGEMPDRNRRRSDLFNVTTPNPFGGVQIVTSPFLPDEQPAIQVRDLYLKDGTRLLSDRFLSRENSWWKEHYGMRPVAFMIGDTMAVSPKVRDIIDRAAKSIDDQLVNMILGRQP